MSTSSEVFMEKNKFLDEVKKRGYEALIDGGVVIVRFPGKAETGIKEIRALAEKLDYNQSWGIRVVTDGSISLPPAKSVKSSDIEADTEPVQIADEKPAKEKISKKSSSVAAVKESKTNTTDDFFDDDEPSYDDEPIDDDGSSYDEPLDDFLDDGDDILSDIDSFKQISLFDFD